MEFLEVLMGLFAYSALGGINVMADWRVTPVLRSLAIFVLSVMHYQEKSGTRGVDNKSL